MRPDLNQAIMDLCREYGEVTVDGGIVYVTEPNGTVWSFTEVMVEDEEG